MESGSNSDKNSRAVDLPFLQHLEELRWRLLKSILSVVVMAGASFYFADELVKLIRIPLGEVQLYNIAVTGTFYAYLKIALVAGVFGALPIIFYQMWSFISPGLYRQEKATILPLVFVSTLLFAAGATFCYFLVLPIAFKFLIGFAGDMVINTITIGSYISFVGLLEIAFGFCFQLPVIAYFFGRIGIINARVMGKGRRYAIVAILIIGAIITPPDIFTQLLLALPLYTLYEISIIVVRLTQRTRAEATAPSEDDRASDLPYSDGE